MKVSTGWLAPPDAIGGIDHLGTQTPCQLIYAQLIPGITNVTDRARYYSLYPWLIWSFDKRFPGGNADKFVQLFRRADFLLTLIGERHGRVKDEPDFLHGAAMAGRTQLPAAMERIETKGAVELDQFATREAVPTRYFKAKLGGLGQYYLGTLVELQLLDQSKRHWIEYTTELGVPLAEAVDAVTASDHFWRVVDAGRVTESDLDSLSSLCPCGLREGTHEHSLLEDLFFADSEQYAQDGGQRRASLAMWLHLALDLGQNPDTGFDALTFRSVVYTGHLPDGQAWDLPPSLTATREWWGTYQANELLSVAFQSLFASALSHLSDHHANSGVPFQTIEALASDLTSSTHGDALVEFCRETSYSEYLSGLKKRSPPIGAWSDPGHEQQLCETLLLPRRDALSSEELLSQAFELIALLIVRADGTRRPYEGLAISAEELQRYPINLSSLRTRAELWCQLSVRDALLDMVHWCLVTHLSVALRKLRQTGKSTFRFRPGEKGLELTEGAPVPTRTTPRFNPTTQMLIDLGALRPLTNERRGTVKVTPLGHAWMSRYEG